MKKASSLFIECCHRGASPLAMHSAVQELVVCHLGAARAVGVTQGKTSRTNVGPGNWTLLASFGKPDTVLMPELDDGSSKRHAVSVC